jgi:hypothetical protein
MAGGRTGGEGQLDAVAFPKYMAADATIEDEQLDTAVPFTLLAGLVRNEKEAAALVQLDVLSLQAETIQEHREASACYSLALAGTISEEIELRLRANDPESTNAALALLLNGLHSVQRAEGLLHARAAEVALGLREKAARLHEHAESNRVTAAELQEEAGCGALAAKKRRLWLVEEGLFHRLKLGRRQGGGS